MITVSSKNEHSQNRIVSHCVSIEDVAKTKQKTFRMILADFTSTTFNRFVYQNNKMLTRETPLISI